MTKSPSKSQRGKVGGAKCHAERTNIFLHHSLYRIASGSGAEKKEKKAAPADKRRGSTIFSDQIIIEIRRKFEGGGTTARVLAEEYGCKLSYMRSILQYKVASKVIDPNDQIA